MAKKAAAKRDPHLRIRIDPKLTARLEKAREANGHTLTGEIVSRLEASFSIAERIAEHKEAQAKLHEAFMAAHRDSREKLDQERAEFEAAKHQAAVLERELKYVERQLNETNRRAAIVDVLLGESAESREAIRAVVLLLANNPEWAASLDSVHKITLNITAAIAAAAAKSTTQGGQDG